MNPTGQPTFGGFGTATTGFAPATGGFGQAPTTGFAAATPGFQTAPGFGPATTGFGTTSFPSQTFGGTYNPAFTGAAPATGLGNMSFGTQAPTSALGAQPAYGGMQKTYGGMQQTYGGMQPLGFMPFQDSSGWRQLRTGNLPQDFQGGVFQIQNELDKSEGSLKTTKHNLDSLHDLQGTIKEKSRQLFSKAKLVVAKQQRLWRAVELRRSFEVDISNFMNEFLKLVEFCRATNVTTKISTPAAFLAELIHRIEDRVRAMETSILELEDLLQAEVTGDSNATMIVQTLKLFQEKFEVVTALVAEVHGRVAAWQARYVDIMRDHYRQDVREMFRDRPDELEVLTAKAEGTDLVPQPLLTQQTNLAASISMRDTIVGRVGVLSTPNMRAAMRK